MAAPGIDGRLVDDRGAGWLIAPGPDPAAPRGMRQAR